MRLLIGHRITGPLGVVTDTRFIRCYWPELNKPTRLFAEGSKGIEVLGSARNVWFPDDTVWLDYYPDALYPAEQAVKAAFPNLLGMVNLTDEQAAIWQAAYDAAVATFPPTHAVHSSPRDCLFLKHGDNVAEIGMKPVLQYYVSELTTQQAMDIVDGNLDPDAEKLAMTFRKIEDSHPDVDPSVKVYEIAVVDGKEVVAEKPKEDVPVDAGEAVVLP